MKLAGVVFLTLAPRLIALMIVIGWNGVVELAVGFDIVGIAVEGGGLRLSL